MSAAVLVMAMVCMVMLVMAMVCMVMVVMMMPAEMDVVGSTGKTAQQ